MANETAGKGSSGYTTRIAGKNLLLAEMIIVIFFFSLASAACVMLFTDAVKDGYYSRDLTAAVIEAQNAAECFKAAGGDAWKMAELMKRTEIPPEFNGIVIYPGGEADIIVQAYNTDSDGALQIDMYIIEENIGLISARISVTKTSSDSAKMLFYELVVETAKEAVT